MPCRTESKTAETLVGAELGVSNRMKWELHPKESALSRKLYVLRLRHGALAVHRRVRGQWTVADRAKQCREASRPMRFAWHPPGPRESPREEWMSWRGSMVRYAFPGWMNYHHGKGPPLVGRTRLYDCAAPNAW